MNTTTDRVVCPHCRFFFNGKGSTVCARCKRLMSATGENRSSETPLHRRFNAVLGWAIGIGWIGICLAIWITGRGVRAPQPGNDRSVLCPATEGRQTSQGPTDPTPIATMAREWLPGTVGSLALSDFGIVIVCRDLDAQKELEELAPARDLDGIRSLVLEGGAFVVDAGTRAKLIKSNMWRGTSRVRILDGRHRGESGWVMSAEFSP